MQRVLWLMIAAGVLVWAGALLDLGGAHDAARKRSSSPADPAAAPAERARAAARDQARTPATAAATAARAQASDAKGARPPAPPGSAQAARPGQGDVFVIGSRPTAAAAPGTTATGAPPGARVAAVDPAQDPLRGELGEGVLSPEYTEIEQSYTDEPRDGAWAMAEEQRIRAVLRDSAVARHVALVHCQETVCHVVLETDSPEAFVQLTQVPGFTAATGIGPSSPYSLRGGQLSVYFHGRRDDAEAPAAQKSAKR